MTLTKNFTHFAVSLAFTWIAGCTKSDTEPNISTEGFSSYSLAWPSKEISVCWINPAPENETYRETLKRAMKEEIEAKTIVSFVGFEACDASQKQEIKVRFANEWPNSGLGTAGNAVTMAQDFSVIKDANGKQAFPNCIGKEQYCTYAIGVHEIMHAIGFYHEQDRTDTPDTCVEKLKDYKTIRNGGYKNYQNVLLGAYDPAQDILAVNELYKNSTDKPAPKPVEEKAKIKVQVYTSQFKLTLRFTNENEFPVRCDSVNLAFSANIYNRAIGGEYLDSIKSNYNFGTLVIPARIRETRVVEVPFQDYIGISGQQHYCGALNWNKGVCQLTSAWMEEGFICRKE
jgi:Astacin (Peptidase family M12A)